LASRGPDSNLVYNFSAPRLHIIRNPKILSRFAELFLQTPEQLIFLALRKRKIVIRELTVFLFQLSLYLIPTALDL